ncbi:hypothetical protein QLQ85_02420 [Halomonas sp. M4R5S39]|uniref:hypothetical protein n=1 Tax=Halomonas kalidii TaxID=3043293 RepID=UPI0024A8E273|nr:hypothetical protein [Halomonas kalidii]MDI5983629.1 hypothetical protein [Halomonas kalidii]
MIEVHVIDVPEFRPMVETLRGLPAVTITGPVKGYWTISAPDELTFNRRAMKMKPAVWYGIFTGGLNGEIAHWGRDEVRIVGTSRPL